MMCNLSIRGLEIGLITRAQQFVAVVRRMSYSCINERVENFRETSAACAYDNH